MAIVVRYMSWWTIQQRLIRLQLLVKSMTGEEIARELLNTLSVEYGISLDSILAMMHDRVSSNGVAMRVLKSVYPIFWTWDAFLTQLIMLLTISKSLFWKSSHEVGSACLHIALARDCIGRSKLAELWLLIAKLDGGVDGKCTIKC